MEMRNATIDDLENICNEQLDFCISEGIKIEDIDYEKARLHIKEDFLKYSEYQRVIIKDNKIIGALFMEVENRYYNDDLILSDQMFFTSNYLSKYTRLKVAISLIRDGIKWAVNNKVKYIEMNMIFRNKSIIRFLEKIGFIINSVSYEMELNYNG